MPNTQSEPLFSARMIGLFGAIFFNVLSFSQTLAAGTYIVSDLGGSTYTTIYAVAFFGLGNAITVPISPWLIERFGAARVLPWSVAVFGICSELCAVATNYPMFILARFLQGVISGPFFILGAGLILGSATVERRQPYFTTIMLIFVAAPVLGAEYGAWFAYDYNWRWIFHAEVPFNLALALLLFCTLRNFPETRPPLKPFDGVGYAAYLLWVIPLSIVLVMGQQLDWHRSSVWLSLLTLGLVSLTFYFFWEWGRPHRFLGLDLCLNPLLAFAYINLMVLFAAYFGMVILLGLWLNLWVEYTQIWIGVILLTVAAAAFVPPILMYRFVRNDTRIGILFGVACIGISAWLSMRFNVEVDFRRIIYSRVLFGFGVAFFLPSILRLIISAPPARTREALVLFQVFRILGSAVGGALFVTLWQRRQVFNRYRLNDELTLFDPPTENYFVEAGELGLTGKPALAQLQQELERQATALALEECFLVMVCLMMGLAVLMGLTLLMQRDRFVPEKRTHFFG